MNVRIFRVRFLLLVFSSAFLFLLAQPNSSHSQTFTVLPGVASPTAFPADALLQAQFPTATIAQPGLGNPVFSTPQIDAISFGRPISEFSLGNELQFSTDLGGASGGDAANEGIETGADIYVESATLVNELLWDGDGVANNGIPIKGPLGLFELNFAGDDVYGWDARKNSPFQAIYFSLDRADAASLRGDNGGDIILAPLNGSPIPNQGNVWATAAQLGLDVIGPNTDDIDALVVFEDTTPGFSSGDRVLFSLTESSLSFGAGVNQTPLSGGNGGNVYLVNGLGSQPSLFRFSGNLGISELDALDFVPIPEPGTLALAGFSLLAIARVPLAPPVWRRGRRLNS